jgi:ketosteroid isomerase-like protein
VRALYAAFHRGDGAAALAHFAPDVVLDASHRVDGRVGHGREELAAIVGEWMEAWDGWKEEIEEIRDLGDRVLVTSVQSGRGRESGVEWANRFAMLFEFRGLEITHWTIYDDVDAAGEAIRR